MDILHEAPNLLQRYRHGDVFRQYVEGRRPLVAAALVVFLAVSMATTAALVVFFGGTHSLLVLAFLLLAPLLLAGSLFVQTFIFFSWLEQRALDQVSGRARRTLKEQVPQIPWALAGGFLVAPFLVLALLSPKVAALLILVVILTPLAFSRLDGE
jgi:hypothetical protein